MDAEIHSTLMVTGITFKLAKDSDGHAYPVAEMKFVTDDLGAAGALAWHLGQEVYAQLHPQQPRLPDGSDGKGVTAAHKPMCGGRMFGEACDCGFAEIQELARSVLAPSADGTTATVTRGRRH